MTESIGGTKVGTKVVSQRRTITEGEFAQMVNLSWETNQLHTDREFAKTTQFGERILGGPCTIPFVAGLAGKALHGFWDQRGARLIALVGMEGVKFKAPLFPGDTIWVETEIAALRRTSNPERFIVTLKDMLYKPEKELILEMLRLVLMQEVVTAEAAGGKAY